jgi:hypothetical protein
LILWSIKRGCSFALFHLDDLEDLSRGLTWSETEVSVGESKRLTTLKCTKRQRAEAMPLYVSSLVSTLPVPFKGKLEQFKDLFDGRASIYTAVDDDTSNNDDSNEGIVMAATQMMELVSWIWSLN